MSGLKTGGEQGEPKANILSFLASWLKEEHFFLFLNQDLSDLFSGEEQIMPTFLKHCTVLELFALLMFQWIWKPCWINPKLKSVLLSVSLED